MNDLRKAAQMALEALEYENDFHKHRKESPYGSTTDAMKALRAAIAQPDELFCDTHCTWRDHHPDCFMARTEKGPEPEPVAYLWQHGETGRTRIIEKDQVWTASNQWNRVGPLYLHPPQRKPLTEEEIYKLFGWYAVPFVRAVEKAHGIGGEHE